MVYQRDQFGHGMVRRWDRSGRIASRNVWWRPVDPCIGCRYYWPGCCLLAGARLSRPFAFCPPLVATLYDRKRNQGSG